jgi:hypothetical protein
MSNMLAWTNALNRRWLSVKRSQSDGFSLALWRTWARSTPKRSAALAMISRSANPVLRQNLVRLPRRHPQSGGGDREPGLRQGDAKFVRLPAVRGSTGFAIDEREQVGETGPAAGTEDRGIPYYAASRR